jgi:hypothetical protein
MDIVSRRKKGQILVWLRFLASDKPEAWLLPRKNDRQKAARRQEEKTTDKTARINKGLANRIRNAVEMQMCESNQCTAKRPAGFERL